MAEVEPKEDRGDELATEELELAAELEEKAKGDVKEGEITSEEGVGEGEATPDTLMLPKSRYDAKNAQLRAAQARIAELEAAVEDRPVEETHTAVPTTFDDQIAAIDKQYAQAVADGDPDKAAAFMREARTLERQRYEDLMAQATQGVVDRTAEDVRYDRVVDTLEDNYPFLNPDEESFNEEIANDVRDLAEAYVASGKYASPDALVIAADLVLGREGLSTQGTTPSAKKTNTAKNADAAGKQPPDTDGLGKASDAAGPTSANPDGSRLSEKEFDALPDEVRARMRGDFT